MSQVAKGNIVKTIYIPSLVNKAALTPTEHLEAVLEAAASPGNLLEAVVSRPLCLKGFLVWPQPPWRGRGLQSGPQHNRGLQEAPRRGQGLQDASRHLCSLDLAATASEPFHSVF